MLQLDQLDDRTRHLMLEEVQRDEHANTLYLSPRLSARGQTDFPVLLRQAVQQHDDNWLAQQLRKEDRLNRTETRTRQGKTHVADVPHTAPETLAEGEFNRFYIRALCVRAIEDGLRLQVYRAKSVTNPRSVSQARVGTYVDPQTLLHDLRSHQGVDTALGLPAGPNSGLSVLLIE